MWRVKLGSGLNWMGLCFLFGKKKKIAIWWLVILSEIEMFSKESDLNKGSGSNEFNFALVKDYWYLLQKDV